MFGAFNGEPMRKVEISPVIPFNIDISKNNVVKLANKDC